MSSIELNLKNRNKLRYRGQNYKAKQRTNYTEKQNYLTMTTPALLPGLGTYTNFIYRDKFVVIRIF